jgi:hypothetical protein
MAGLPPWLNKGKDNGQKDSKGAKMSPKQAAIARRLEKNKKGKK